MSSFLTANQKRYNAYLYFKNIVSTRTPRVLIVIIPLIFYTSRIKYEQFVNKLRDKILPIFSRFLDSLNIVRAEIRVYLQKCAFLWYNQNKLGKDAKI